MRRLTNATCAKIAGEIVLYLAICLVIGIGINAASYALGSVVRYGVVGGMPAESERQLGNAVIPASQVSSIEISWLAGTVEVKAVPDEESTLDGVTPAVAVSETGSTKDFPLLWYVENGRLCIDYAEQTALFMGCTPFAWVGQKNLTVSIPESLARSLDEFSVAAASGTYAIHDIACNDFIVEMASGEIDVKAAQAKRFTLSQASGRSSFDMDVEDDIEFEMASGDCRLSLADAVPMRFAGDMMSGAFSLTLPASAGFTLDLEKASGSFSSPLPLTQTNGRYSYTPEAASKTHGDDADSSDRRDGNAKGSLADSDSGDEIGHASGDTHAHIMAMTMSMASGSFEINAR